MDAFVNEGLWKFALQPYGPNSCPPKPGAASSKSANNLNYKVVARLRFLNQMRSHSALLEFRIGERVKFRPTGRPDMAGILTQYNTKTVTVITDSGEHWNVSPSLLSKVESGPAGSARREDLKIVPLPNPNGEKEV
jgi:hypothetical protein